MLVILLAAFPAAASVLTASFCRSVRPPGEAQDRPTRLAAEIARRGDRSTRRGLGTSARRRHLAAVLPADGRR